MYMIEISEDKVMDLAEHLEKGIKYIGKAMQCVDELKDSHMGERGSRSGYGNRMDEEWEEEEFGERRGRMGNRMSQRGGRYSRY